jgi:hypothetical protein
MDEHHDIDMRAPVSQWQIIDRFDSVDACRKNAMTLMDDADERSESWRLTRLLKATCVSTEDTRLKRK